MGAERRKNFNSSLSLQSQKVSLLCCPTFFLPQKPTVLAPNPPPLDLMPLLSPSTLFTLFFNSIDPRRDIREREKGKGLPSQVFNPSGRQKM